MFLGSLRSASTILGSWTLEPVTVALLVGSLVWYVWAAGRFRLRTGAPYRGTKPFVLGLGAVTLALVSPIHRYSELLLSVHMVQHILLTLVAAPLLLLGAPVTLALRTHTSAEARRWFLRVLHSGVVRVLTNPVVSWGLFAAVLWGTHFTQIYELSLEHEWIHSLEHAAYLGSALLFWSPVIARDPSPVRISHPARILYLFLAMPQMTFLGLAIYGSDQVLYRSYLSGAAALGISAIGDQHLAGALMWATGMFLIVPALGFVLMDWLDREEREAKRQEARAGSA
jgi:putative membrane protein